MGPSIMLHFCDSQCKKSLGICTSDDRAEMMDSLSGKDAVPGVVWVLSAHTPPNLNF